MLDIALMPSTPISSEAPHQESTTSSMVQNLLKVDKPWRQNRGKKMKEKRKKYKQPKPFLESASIGLFSTEGMKVRKPLNSDSHLRAYLVLHFIFGTSHGTALPLQQYGSVDLLHLLENTFDRKLFPLTPAQP